MNCKASVVGISLLAGAVTGLAGSSAWAQANSFQGSWRSGDTTIRITVNKNELRAQFAEVGAQAKALGFKPGDLSFTGVQRDQFITGDQMIRYGNESASCFKAGRKVPMMGKLTPDGQVLALHFYNVVVDAQCRDLGQYGVTETLWQRAAR